MKKTTIAIIILLSVTAVFAQRKPGYKSFTDATIIVDKKTGGNNYRPYAMLADDTPKKKPITKKPVTKPVTRKTKIDNAGDVYIGEFGTGGYTKEKPVEILYAYVSPAAERPKSKLSGAVEKETWLSPDMYSSVRSYKIRIYRTGWTFGVKSDSTFKKFMGFELIGDTAKFMEEFNNEFTDCRGVERTYDFTGPGHGYTDTAIFKAVWLKKDTTPTYLSVLNEKKEVIVAAYKSGRIEAPDPLRAIDTLVKMVQRLTDKKDTVHLPVFLVDVTDTINVATIMYKKDDKSDRVYTTSGFALVRGFKVMVNGKPQWADKPQIVGALDDKKRLIKNVIQVL